MGASYETTEDARAFSLVLVRNFVEEEYGSRDALIVPHGVRQDSENLKHLWTFVITEVKQLMLSNSLITDSRDTVLEDSFTAYARSLYVHLFLSLHLVHRSMLQRSIWPECLSS